MSPFALISTCLETAKSDIVAITDSISNNDSQGGRGSRVLSNILRGISLQHRGGCDMIVHG